MKLGHMTYWQKILYHNTLCVPKFTSLALLVSLELGMHIFNAARSHDILATNLYPIVLPVYQNSALYHN